MSEFTDDLDAYVAEAMADPAFAQAYRCAARGPRPRWLDRCVQVIHDGVIAGFDKLWYG